MRMMVQRVSEASVAVAGELVSVIGPGLLVLVGVAEGDGEDDLQWLVAKILRLRVFADAEGKMNLSVIDVNAELLVVSQFTLLASTRKGNRPSFQSAAAPAVAEQWYERCCAAFERASGKPVARGRFGADMQVSLINDGPVTLWLDSRARE